MMPVASYTPIPFSTPCDDMFAMLVYATRQFYVRLYMLVYMSMHEPCLLMCRPCFNAMRLWTSNPNVHLSLTNTTFCLLSCLFTLCFLFAILLVYPFAYLFILHPFSIINASLPIHCSAAGFLSLPLHVHIWSEDTWSQGMTSWAQAKRARMQACQHESNGYVQQVQGLAFPFGYVLFYTPSFLLPFSLRWFVLGISCFVPFILVSRVWQPLFIFLHLYFGSCFGNVGIYFPAMCQHCA